MAVWSSLPPKVPTPRSPASSPKLCPFSRVPRYSARCSRSGTARTKRGSCAMPERSMSTSASPTIRAEELDMPAAGGRVEVISTSAPRSMPGKFASSRAATVRT
ncbi:hypothetical protein BF93_03355 [Brachybacterium phenoliresistens]|uniref:Uncharacterized protein n=1 Tax=Brachybacterium phenoliresistens TaxID=396014 RepID=Z9JRP9_9MICO|nr:hypothetical protein BF93_03355 [Brachybacterium phenoliresistens]